MRLLVACSSSIIGGSRCCRRGECEDIEPCANPGAVVQSVSTRERVLPAEESLMAATDALSASRDSAEYVLCFFPSMHSTSGPKLAGRFREGMASESKGSASSIWSPTFIRLFAFLSQAVTGFVLKRAL